jgi:hypothetical protein
MNLRIECQREDRENLKPANISTHTVLDKSKRKYPGAQLHMYAPFAAY